MSTDELYYQAIDLLKELIETPSISREENNAANVLEQYLKNIYPYKNQIFKTGIRLGKRTLYRHGNG